MIWTIVSGLIVGILLGFVMQRTRFCLTGGFRDMYVQKNNNMFYALLIAITIQAIGLIALTGFGVLTIDNGTFPLIGTIIGAFLFGIGIVLAGGCATGTWYRAGEGLIGSWIALAMYALFAAMTKNGLLKPVMEGMNSKTVGNADMVSTTGIPFTVLVLILTAVTLYFVVKTLRKDRKSTRLNSSHVSISYAVFCYTSDADIYSSPTRRSSDLALAMYALFAAMTKNGLLKPVMEGMNSKTVGNADMVSTTGIPFTVLVLILTAVTLYFVVKTLR